MKAQPFGTANKSLLQMTEELSAVAGSAVDELQELQSRTEELRQRVQHLRAMVGLIGRRLEREK